MRQCMLKTRVNRYQLDSTQSHLSHPAIVSILWTKSIREHCLKLHPASTWCRKISWALASCERSKGVRTCRDWKWPIDMAMGQKPRCWRFKILGHIGPICCTFFSHIPYIYIYIFALSLPSGSHPPMPGYQEQLWYQWLLPGFFMIPEGSFRRSQKRPMLKKTNYMAMGQYLYRYHF